MMDVGIDLRGFLASSPNLENYNHGGFQLLDLIITELKSHTICKKFKAPIYLLLPLGKRGSKWGDFHWAMGCV